MCVAGRVGPRALRGPGDRDPGLGRGRGRRRGRRPVPAGLPAAARLAGAQLHAARARLHHQLPGAARHQVPLHALLLQRHLRRPAHVESDHHHW